MLELFLRVTGGGDERVSRDFDGSVAAAGGRRLAYSGLKRVADVAELLDDGLLDEDELFDLWARAPKAPAPDAAAADGAASGLTLGGFALVIAEIDALFELEEDDDES